jgi:hypothetical protein
LSQERPESRTTNNRDSYCLLSGFCFSTGFFFQSVEVRIAPRQKGEIMADFFDLTKDIVLKMIEHKLINHSVGGSIEDRNKKNTEEVCKTVKSVYQAINKASDAN